MYLPVALVVMLLTSLTSPKGVRRSAMVGFVIALVLTLATLVEGETVVVFSPNVKSPTQVRFGWHKIANPNLVNSAGLPASPFQTNKWSGGTGVK